MAGGGVPARKSRRSANEQSVQSARRARRPSIRCRATGGCELQSEAVISTRFTFIILK